MFKLHFGTVHFINATDFVSIFFFLFAHMHAIQMNRIFNQIETKQNKKWETRNDIDGNFGFKSQIRLTI